MLICPLSLDFIYLTFNFPRPMTNKKNFDFSFSGLKTAVYYEFKKIHEIDYSKKADLAASFQAAVADTLLIKTKSLGLFEKNISLCESSETISLSVLLLSPPISNLYEQGVPNFAGSP